MVSFKVHEFTTAEALLSSLRLSNAEWWTYHEISKEPDHEWQRSWIFRGESSTKKWPPLVPVAWRDTAPDDAPDVLTHVLQDIGQRPEFWVALRETINGREFIRLFGQVPEDEQQEKNQRMGLALLRAFAEIWLINEFSLLADELGFNVSHLPDWTRKWAFLQTYSQLAFPGIEPQSDADDASLRSKYDYLLDAIWGNPAVAFARHHGLPTRLLDWTKSPIAAAYFAASGVEMADADDHIAIYALHRELLNYHIRIVGVSYSGNEYLRAQHGVFTLDTKGDEFFLLNGHYPNLEKSLSLLPSHVSSFVHPRKFIMPVSQAPELLRLLWIERITQAHLMPTLDNVASAVKMKLRLIGALEKWDME